MKLYASVEKCVKMDDYYIIIHSRVNLHGEVSPTAINNNLELSSYAAGLPGNVRVEYIKKIASIKLKFSWFDDV